MNMLAYLIVLLISQFALTVATFVVVSLGFLVGWLPERLRMPSLGIASGVAGVSLSVLLARLLFGWLAGPDSFGVGPFLAATIPLAVPVWNDWKKYQELNQRLDGMPSNVAEFAAGPTAAMGAAPLGAILGVILNGALLL